ncbi:hypothetical protein D9753_34105 [Streptomyces dangxiongensis]|uniref:Uncharacterized protein n=1 Tax=Streptomyces dangxiongensis TaxID=1442032 RepID=A0A3G2JL62_9ACTN|nr:DUF6098 family protein [Streptomyces dangxiongensis]AYN43084.1 hypothetical protein D9753_34105 [Streptomyces dangxiongensis]
MSTTAELPTLTSLDELARLVTGRRGLYVRWSRGPERDLPRMSSKDDLTGIRLPGLSVSSLDIEDWWGSRPPTVWVARRLYDYCHLPRVKDARTRPWVLRGSEAARGPDNEPLVTDVEPLGWIADPVITEACRVITEQPGRWGTLDRDGADGTL